MNVYVRLSAAGVAEKYREDLDYRCGSLRQVLGRIRILSDAAIPVSLRVQPIIPGFEKSALSMAEKAISVGAKHISFEYLKIAGEDSEVSLKAISKAIGSNIWNEMERRGLKRFGRDYSLAPDAKAEFVAKARDLCHRLGAKFGAGDTEFIPYSDGHGCCSGAGHFLKRANEFQTNFTGVISQRMGRGPIRFSDLLTLWSPHHSIKTYLTTDSRKGDESGRYSNWVSLIAHRWNGTTSPYSPAFFAGVTWDGKYDSEGYKIYKFSDALRSGHAL